jgi:hypothetical protein
MNTVMDIVTDFDEIWWSCGAYVDYIFTSKKFSSKFERGLVLKGCKVLGKLPLPLTKNANIFGSS